MQRHGSQQPGIDAWKSVPAGRLDELIAMPQRRTKRWIEDPSRDDGEFDGVAAAVHVTDLDILPMAVGPDAFEVLQTFQVVLIQFPHHAPGDVSRVSGGHGDGFAATIRGRPLETQRMAAEFGDTNETTIRYLSVQRGGKHRRAKREVPKQADRRRLRCSAERGGEI